MFVSSTSDAGPFVPGDVNGDGAVNVQDASVLRRTLAGLPPGVSQTCSLSNLAGSTCENLGLGSGPITCSPACDVDTSQCSACSDLMYLIDDQSRLLSFDPRKVGTAQSPFAIIGSLGCPASSTPVPGYFGPVVPYSIAIARGGFARVLYTSGQLFLVNLTDASCFATSFVPQQGNQWLLFNQALASDAPGGATDTEFVGGGSVDAAPGGRFGTLNSTSLAIANIGFLPNDGEFSPALTGLGDSTLFGFYGGLSTAFVQQINKATGGAVGGKLSIAGGLGPNAVSWAFGFWGGGFYVFLTTNDGLTQNSLVKRIDRTTGAVSTLLPSIPYVIIGASQATCAPLTPP